MASVGYSVDPEFAQMMHQSTGTAGKMRRMMEELSAKVISVTASDHAMEPLVKHGDQMVFGACKIDNTRAGDIVLYRYQDRAVTRRIVRKAILNGEAVYHTKADSSKTIDPPVKVALVFGRLIYVERNGRKIKARSLNRGIVDYMTDYGTRSVFQKLMSFAWALLPSSMRPNKA